MRVTTSDDLVIDDITGLVWYKNVAFFENQNYLEQLDSILSLDDTLDIDGDGHFDRLTWRFASFSDVNDLIVNYGLESEVNREEIMDYFHATRVESQGNISLDTEVWGRVGESAVFGYFKIFQSYLYHPAVTAPGYVHDPYGYGEIEVSGPFDAPQPGDLHLPIEDLGAWVVADVEYGADTATPGGADDTDTIASDNAGSSRAGGCFITTAQTNRKKMNCGTNSPRMSSRRKRLCRNP